MNARASCVALLAITSAILLASAGAAEDVRRPKKLIEIGWDIPDTGQLRQNLPQMQQRPFDGVVLQAVGRRDDGKPCRLNWAFLGEKWQRPWFQPCIDDLKACRFGRFTHNFLVFLANPGSVDWFDDEGWQNIVEHWRIAAWVAKQSGLKGLGFDPEPYAPPHAQFQYSAQPQRGQHSFEEYWAKARQRGRQIIEAVAAEYPDITLLCFFMNSANASAAGHADPKQALRAEVYGLYPALIDGWLDAAPPTITFVDGCESAYRYNSRQEYLEAAVEIKGLCQNLVSPENRGKYRAQVQVSYGMYLDAYWNPKTSPWYVDGLGGERVERLRVNTQTALCAADQYVWVYGEKFRWWPTENRSVRPQSWPEALPGSDRALHYARDPIGFARAEIAAQKTAGKAANLARNGDFSAETLSVEGHEEKSREGGRPVGWHAWQDERSKGTFTWDRQIGHGSKGAARAAGVSNGCFLQHHEVKPPQRYAVGAFCRLQGRGQAWLRIRWQTAEGKWTAEQHDQLFFASGPPDQWRELFGVVEVPEEAGKLLILLSVGGQSAPEDVAWFDDVELYRLP